ncbi:MAG: AraC family transcriptional regulator [Chloroflexota bacterium]|nr:AraC family transcriptional regulator [Chloroflexota bacterium]
MWICLIVNSMNTAYIPDNVSAGLVVYPLGGTLGPRWQPSIQFVFLHRGTMTIWVDHQPLVAKQGSVTLLLPNHQERFAFSTTSETEHSWFHLSYGSHPASLIAQLEPLVRTQSTSPAMLELVKAALNIRRSELPSAGMLLRTLAFAILWRYQFDCDQQRAETTTSHMHISVEQALRYIDSHLDESITLQALATAASVSPTHLIRLFRAQFGMTPMTYLWEQRVYRGLELLRYTGLPIGVIAEKCGFKTSYHFSRRIRAAVQLSPQEVRQQFFARSLWE